MGFTVYGQKVSVPMPWLLMYTAMDVYHAPQMKNCRNIMAPRRVPMDFIDRGVGARVSQPRYLQAAGSCLMKYAR